MKVLELDRSPESIAVPYTRLMAMGKKRTRNRQTSMWVATVDLPRSAGHPFYDRLNRVLDDAGFDAFVEAQCAPFYTFADILNRRQPNVVKDKLNEWLSWASRSRLPGFVKVARTIRTHLDEIVAYIRWGVTNGIVEGLHNKVRVIIRRAFGFHSASAVIGMIMLCCTNLELHPPRLSLAK